MVAGHTAPHCHTASPQYTTTPKVGQQSPAALLNISGVIKPRSHLNTVPTHKPSVVLSLTLKLFILKFGIWFLTQLSVE